MKSMDIPSLKDWLIGQSHRDDLVGTLSRLSVSDSQKIKEMGFEAWLTTLEDGIILKPAVEDARAQHGRCVDELGTIGHSESFPIWAQTLTEERQIAWWAKHKTEPDKSPEQYLHGLHKQLRKDVESVARLYLDTNHWIRLLNVVLNRMKPADTAYGPVLAKLRALRAQNKLICPLSFPLFHELMKQNDPITRRQMAALMDELSAGVCIQPPNQMERIELKRQMLRSVLGPDAPDVGEWIWTKASGVCGEWLAQPKSDALPIADVTTVRKMMIDVMWNTPLAALAEFPSTVGNDPLADLAKAYVADAEDYRARSVPFERVLMEQKVIYGRQLFINEIEKIGNEVQRQFPAECAMYESRGGNQQSFDPTILASIQIKAAVFASFIVSTQTKKILANDVLDAVHASIALPHFDAACVDRGMAHRLMSPPLRFDQIYRARIFSTPEELINWLSTL